MHICGVFAVMAAEGQFHAANYMTLDRIMVRSDKKTIVVSANPDTSEYINRNGCVFKGRVLPSVSEMISLLQVLAATLRHQSMD
jgi:hypothetical protein